MKTVWHSLLWKEWHEHKWKLAALTAIIFAVPMLFAVDDPRSLLVGVTAGLIGYGVIAGAFLGMSVAGGESTRKTLALLQGMPTPMWQPAIVKLLVAAATVSIPILLVVEAGAAFTKTTWINPTIVAEAMDWESNSFPHCWGITDWFTARLVGGVLGTCSLLLWMAAAGVNRSDEIRAGAIGFLVVVLTWLTLAYATDRVTNPTVEYGIMVLLAAAPGGPAFINARIEPLSYLPFIASAVLGHLGVLAWYLRRFGRAAARPSGAVAAVSTAGRRTTIELPPRQSQFTAIAWKQYRETAPLALAAAVAVLAMTALYFAFDDKQFDWDEFGAVLGAIALSVGFLVTMVAGIGVYLEDYKPNVNTFWRSRPLNVHLWFGVKFVAGWVVLAAVFGVLLALSTALNTNWLTGSWYELVLQLGFFIWIFTLVYTLAMATYCLLRQPIYAAVATFGLLFGGMYAYALLFEQGPPHWSVGMAFMLAAEAAALVLAWQAVRRDWGWKG